MAFEYLSGLRAAAEEELEAIATEIRFSFWREGHDFSRAETDANSIRVQLLKAALRGSYFSQEG
jgi:hypothetical protein